MRWTRLCAPAERRTKRTAGIGACITVPGCQRVDLKGLQPVVQLKGRCGRALSAVSTVFGEQESFQLALGLPATSPLASSVWQRRHPAGSKHPPTSDGSTLAATREQWCGCVRVWGVADWFLSHVSSGVGGCCGLVFVEAVPAIHQLLDRRLQLALVGPARRLPLDLRKELRDVQPSR